MEEVPGDFFQTNHAGDNFEEIIGKHPEQARRQNQFGRGHPTHLEKRTRGVGGQQMDHGGISGPQPSRRDGQNTNQKDQRDIAQNFYKGNIGIERLNQNIEGDKNGAMDRRAQPRDPKVII